MKLSRKDEHAWLKQSFRGISLSPGCRERETSPTSSLGVLSAESTSICAVNVAMLAKILAIFTRHRCELSYKGECWRDYGANFCRNLHLVVESVKKMPGQRNTRSLEITQEFRPRKQWPHTDTPWQCATWTMQLNWETVEDSEP